MLDAVGLSDVRGKKIKTLVPVVDWQADDAAAGTPDSVPVSTSWGDRDGYGQVQMFQFSGAFAVRAVTGFTRALYGTAPICGARELLDRPAADPATGLDEAARLFGLRAPDGSLC